MSESSSSSPLRLWSGVVFHGWGAQREVPEVEKVLPSFPHRRARAAEPSPVENSPNVELEMARGDTLHTQLLSGIHAQLQHLSGDVLEDGAWAPTLEDGAWAPTRPWGLTRVFR